MKKLCIPPVFLFISLVLIIGFHFFISGFNCIPFPYYLAGIIFIFWGITLNGKARDLFNKYKTPHTFEKAERIIDEGLFKKTRNPMYIGQIILLTGFAVCFGNLFSLIMPFIYFLILSAVFIPFEEGRMEAIFGEEYLDYKKRVKRWL